MTGCVRAVCLANRLVNESTGGRHPSHAESDPASNSAYIKPLPYPCLFYLSFSFLSRALLLSLFILTHVYRRILFSITSIERESEMVWCSIRKKREDIFMNIWKRKCRLDLKGFLPSFFPDYLDLLTVVLTICASRRLPMISIIFSFLPDNHVFTPIMEVNKTCMTREGLFLTAWETEIVLSNTKYHF